MFPEKKFTKEYQTHCLGNMPDKPHASQTRAGKDSDPVSPTTQAAPFK